MMALLKKTVVWTVALLGSLFCAPLYAVITPPDMPSFKMSKNKAPPSKKSKAPPSKANKTLPPQKIKPLLVDKPSVAVPKAITVLTKRNKKTKLYRVTLQWKEAKKASLFFYRDIGYLVFNAVGKFLPGTFPSSHFKSISVVPHATATILRFKLKKDKDLIINRLGDEWFLLAGELGNEDTTSLYPLVVTPKKDQKSINILNDENETLITFQDPKTGDTFSVQPDVNRGIDRLYETPFFDILESYQGLVYLLKNPENLTVQLDKEAHATVISLKSGGLISSVDIFNKNRDPASLQPLVDLDKYDIPKGNVFHVGRVMRKAVAVEVKKDKRLQNKIELAKFYMATGQYYEAIGVLDLLKEKHETLFFSQDELILMMDLAQVLAHDVDDDSFLSNGGHFNGEAERDVLLALQEQRFGRYATALTKYVRAYKFIQSLPPLIRNDIALKAYEARVESSFKSPLFAGLINKKLLSKRDFDSVKYYKAQATNIINPLASLQKTYTKLTFSPNKKVALLARLALVDKDNMAKKSVINDLESMLFTWRGDIVEQRFLATLAELYRKAGEPDKALATLREISNYLWKFEKSHVYTKLAGDLFYSSFMGMKDEPFLKQIAYYYEFEDLTPKGKRYGEIIDRITGLYVKVGLIDQAISALTQRMKYLHFEKRRKILADAEFRHLMNLTLKRMAELYLATNQPPLALKMLDRLKPFEANEESQDLDQVAFEQGVKFLKAVTYLALDKKENALKSIEGLTSKRDNRLRADIYMAQKRWSDAFPLLEEMLKDTKGEEIEDDFDVDAVLDIAVAAFYLKNKERLQELKTDYGMRIKDLKKRQAFEMIVSSPTSIEMSKGKIEGQLTIADNYAKLMDGIKKDILETSWPRVLSRKTGEEAPLSPDASPKSLGGTPESLLGLPNTTASNKKVEEAPKKG